MSNGLFHYKYLYNTLKLNGKKIKHRTYSSVKNPFVRGSYTTKKHFIISQKIFSLMV